MTKEEIRKLIASHGMFEASRLIHMRYREEVEDLEAKLAASYELATIQTAILRHESILKRASSIAFDLIRRVRALEAEAVTPKEGKQI
jgi:uncharacterized membrane protein